MCAKAEYLHWHPRGTVLALSDAAPLAFRNSGVVLNPAPAEWPVSPGQNSAARAASDATKSAQIKVIAAMGNPFKER